MDELLKGVWEENSSAKQDKTNEFERFQAIPQVNANVDVLDWWKQNCQFFPIISKIAQVYLSIPASQADCERSFSTANKICSEIRTSLSPSHVEKLTVLKQNYNLLVENKE